MSNKSAKTRRGNKNQPPTPRRGPLRLKPRGSWDETSAARIAARERNSLTHAYLTFGTEQDILSYVLGLRFLLDGMPALAETMESTDPAEQSEVIREALQDRKSVERCLDEAGIPTSPMDPLGTPVAVGRTIAMQLAAELDPAPVYVLDTDAFFALVDVATRLTPAEIAHLGWKNTGLTSGFMLFPETVHVMEGEHFAGNLLAVSWAQARTRSYAEALRASAWSQTYGDTEEAWKVILDNAQSQGAVLPRLTYGGSSWALLPGIPGAVNLTPSGLPLVDHADGVAVSSLEGNLYARLAITAVNMISEGILTEVNRVDAGGTEVRSLTLNMPTKSL